MRQPTTQLGGARHQDGNLLTKVFIGINVAVWLAGLLIGRGSFSQELLQASGGRVTWDEVTARLGLVLGTNDPFQLGVADGEWYRVITAAFVHEEFWHIGINMLLLWVLGSPLEPILGRWRFTALYLLSALGGSAVSLMSGEAFLMSIGASGAVFGVFGAFVVVMQRLGRDITFAAVFLGINFIFGFIREGVDWRAHLGGLVVGAALGYVFARAPREHRTAWSVAACLAMLAAIVTAVAVIAA